jgi:glycerol-3-phosphate acyltransferase PlsY
MFIIGAFLAYFLGSIPFGVIFSKIFKLGDIQKVGSGNIGATNILRTGNKKAAGLTLVFDVLKGWFPVWLYISYTASVSMDLRTVAVAFAAIIGHVFPIWLKGRGGKGVATTAGVYIAISPIYMAVLLLIWGLTFAFIRISSLSALVSICIFSPIIGGVHMFQSGNPCLLIFSLLCAFLIAFTHRQNILRIIKGTELKIK